MLDKNPPSSSSSAARKHGLDAHVRRLRSFFQGSRGWIMLTAIIGALLLLTILLAGDADTVHKPTSTPPAQHPSARDHLPIFITAPGQTDVLLGVVALVLVGAVFGMGVFFFWLHSLPERLVHTSTKVHFDIVAVLALLSLFTHIHLFWVAALLIALVKIPDFSMPDVPGLLDRIALSLERIARGGPNAADAPSRETTDKPRQDA
jgi:hypothetical protein